MLLLGPVRQSRPPCSKVESRFSEVDRLDDRSAATACSSSGPTPCSRGTAGLEPPDRLRGGRRPGPGARTERRDARQGPAAVAFGHTAPKAPPPIRRGAHPALAGVQHDDLCFWGGDQTVYRWPLVRDTRWPLLIDASTKVFSSAPKAI